MRSHIGEIFKGRLSGVCLIRGNEFFYLLSGRVVWVRREMAERGWF
jgi:hypothetical protein